MSARNKRMAGPVPRRVSALNAVSKKCTVVSAAGKRNRSQRLEFFGRSDAGNDCKTFVVDDNEIGIWDNYKDDARRPHPAAREKAAVKQKPQTPPDSGRQIRFFS